MKKITLTLTAIILALSMHAQDDKSKTSSQASGMENKKAQTKEFVIMKDGKMMMMKDGKMVTMDKEKKMTDGSKVSTDGIVTFKDGRQEKLKDGSKIYSDGTIETGGKRDPKPGPPPPPTDIK